MSILFIILFSAITYGQEPIVYNTIYSKVKDIPQGTQEILYHQEGGFYRYFVYRGKLFDAYVTTNANAETVLVTMIRDNNTNLYSVDNNILTTPNKIIKMDDLMLIPFPEVQLKDFVQDSNQTKMEYWSVRMDELSTHRIVAKKLDKTKEGLIPVQITFKGLIASLVKFVYYFSPVDGIAQIKEGYFLSRKPSYIMELQKEK